MRQAPGSARGHVGLGRVATARGDREEAQRQFGAAAEIAPSLADAWLGLATTAEDPDKSREWLERALRANPSQPAVHAELAARTGRAPRRATSLDDAITLANRHPYDPVTLAEAGERLVEVGRTEEALPVLEAAFSLNDLDRAAGAHALDALRRLDPAWRNRRVVRVWVSVDAELASRRGWQFRQRKLWQDLSSALAPVLDTRFVVEGFGRFDASAVGAALVPMLHGIMRQTANGPTRGIVAAFTATRRPPHPASMRGVADYMGRHLVVRDLPDGDTFRVLVHEVVHLYGGVHVIDEIDSLMNGGGKSRRLDALNERVARSLASRSFGSGGLDREVLERIDLEEASVAFKALLGTNLTYRNNGLAELISSPYRSPRSSAREVYELKQLDPHLADVSRFVARLLWEEGNRVQAVQLMDTASSLYGERTAEGRATRHLADRLRAQLRRELVGE